MKVREGNDREENGKFSQTKGKGRIRGGFWGNLRVSGKKRGWKGILKRGRKGEKRRTLQRNKGQKIAFGAQFLSFSKAYGQHISKGKQSKAGNITRLQG